MGQLTDTYCEVTAIYAEQADGSRGINGIYACTGMPPVLIALGYNETSDAWVEDSIEFNGVNGRLVMILHRRSDCTFFDAFMR